MLLQGIKMIVQHPQEKGNFADLPECYGEQEIGLFRPKALGPSVGPACWYVHRLLDWIPAGVLQGQDSVIDDIVRWIVLQDDPLQKALIRKFPKYMEGVQLQLPPIAQASAATEERVHHFLVTLKVKSTNASIAKAKEQIIKEIDELMRWPSPMAICGIAGVQRISDSE